MCKTEEPNRYVQELISSKNNAGTAKDYKKAMDDIAAFLLREEKVEDMYLFYLWESVRLSVFQKVREHLISKGLAPATINRMLAPLRGVVEICYKYRKIPAEDVLAIRDTKNLKIEPYSKHIPNESELNALDQVCLDDPSKAGIRDLALIKSIVLVGLYRMEIYNLEYIDWHSKECEINIEHGAHGRNGRFAPIEKNKEELRKVMNAWIELRGNASGKMFCGINKGGVITAKKENSSQMAQDAIKKRGKEAGIPWVTMQNLRMAYRKNIKHSNTSHATHEVKQSTVS